ncbi:MAG: AsmA family protein [Xanthomonadales bacterium]
MKRVFKILLGLLGGIIVLLILAALLLPLIYDQEDLEKTIAAKVSDQTGRELSIDGALNFSVFPWLAVEVNDLRLSNADGFGDRPFARIARARVGVALLPLFRKQIVVDEITLDGLDLALVVNARGENNWADLADGGGTESVTVAQDGASEFSSQRVAGLNIRNARIEFQDQPAGTHYLLSGFSLQTGALGGGKPVTLELSTLLEDLAGGTRVEVDLAATVEIDLQAQTLQMESFSAQLAGLEIDGALSVRNIFDDPAFSGSLSVAEFSPTKLMGAMHIELPVTADPKALQRARLSTSFSGNSSMVKLSDFEFELDQSRFTGEMSIRNFAQPRIGFEFAVDEIDIDRYLEPATDQTGQVDVTMPREELQGQDVQGTLRAGKMRLAGLDFSAAELGLSIRNGKLRLNPITAGFYGGTYSGDITLDSSGPVPVLSLNEKVDSIAFQQLVTDWVDTESLSGMARGHVRLTGRGASSNEVIRNLNGDLGLTLTDGALEGINIWYQIRRGLALYKGLAPPPIEPKRTVFSRMQLSANVANGVVTTRELVAELPFLSVSGSGTVDLGQSSVDLRLVATIHNAPELAKDPLAARLRGKRLPFRISGPLDDPDLAVDWKVLLQSKATGMLLDKLGLAPNTAPQDGANGDQEPASLEKKLENAAKGALFKLLRGKDKNQDDDG